MARKIQATLTKDMYDHVKAVKRIWWLWKYIRSGQ